MYLIALDPADDGSAVLLRQSGTGPPEVVAVVYWRKRKRVDGIVWELRWWGARGPSWVRTPGEIGAACAYLLPAPPIDSGSTVPPPVAVLVMEAPFVYRNPHTSLRIARFGGLVAGGLQAELARTAPDGRAPVAVELQPSAWRAILGLSAPDREAAKARSLAGMPVLVPTLAPVLQVLGPVDDVSDAAGIGLVGFLLEAWKPGFEARVLATVAARTGSKRAKRRA